MILLCPERCRTEFPVSVEDSDATLSDVDSHLRGAHLMSPDEALAALARVGEKPDA